MRIPREKIEEVLNASDIVDFVEAYVPLKKSGNEFWACCPFHQEKTPSFKVNPDRQLFYCFGCQQSGNIFHFIMEQENVDFSEAVKILAQRAGITLPEEGTSGEQAKEEKGFTKDKLYNLLREVGRWYHRLLKGEKGEGARNYLENRAIDFDTVKKFGLGYAPDNWDALLKWGGQHGYSPELLEAAGLVKRSDKGGGAHPHWYDRFRDRLMFPVFDEIGRVIGFSGRLLKQEEKAAKYINTPETTLFHKSRVLYGMDKARQAFKETGCALLCEGQLDVIACHKAGLTHAVAPQGTAFTETHATWLKRHTKEVVFAFDSDEAGQKAAWKSIATAAKVDLKASVVSLPEDEDPADIIRGHGPQKLQAIMSEKLEGFEYLVKTVAQNHELNKPDEKQAAASEILQIIAQMNDPVRRAAYAQWLGAQLQLPESALFQNLNKLVQQQQRREGGPRHTSSSEKETSGNGEKPKAATPKTSRSGLGKLQHAECVLLDLALHHGYMAHDLAERFDVSMLDNSPVARALNLVLDKTAEGEWEHAASAIAADPELANVPSIAETLLASKFEAIPESAEEDHRRKLIEEKLRKAANDCLLVIEQNTINTRIAELQKRLENDSGESEQSEKLLQEYCALVRRRSQAQQNQHSI